MPSTNKTPNYGLSQYVADDKPTYLGDYNKDMLDIDTNMKQIDDKTVSNTSAIETANTNASQALQTANSAQTSASNAQTTADLAKGIAQSASTEANNALELADEVYSETQKISNWITADITQSGLNGKITANYNKSLKLLNVFGYASPNTNAPITIGNLTKLGASKPTPKQEILVYFGGSYKETDIQNTTLEQIKINTDGSIQFPSISSTNTIEQIRVNFTLCLADSSRWTLS